LATNPGSRKDPGTGYASRYAHDQEQARPGFYSVVLLDHDVNSYLPDLKRLEAEGLITKGTVVLCDWSLYPGSDDYGRPLQVPTDGKEFMTYLAQAGRPTATHSLTGKEVFTVSSWTGVV
jgi:predicted O-methyltransferase YrrM